MTLIYDRVSSALGQCSNNEKTGLNRADPTVAFYPTQQLSTAVIGILITQITTQMTIVLKKSFTEFSLYQSSTKKPPNFLKKFLGVGLGHVLLILAILSLLEFFSIAAQ